MSSSTAFPPGDGAAGRRGGGLVAVAVPAGRVTRPVFGRRGFVSGALVVDWPAIVGSAVAAHTQPERIRFPTRDRSGGTLVIKVASSAFATELQHLEPLILERVNSHFGYRAVARLHLRHGPLPLPASRRPLRPSPDVAEGESGGGDAALAAVEDPELRAVLARLGRRLGR
jgi:hypothetical protein